MKRSSVGVGLNKKQNLQGYRIIMMVEVAENIFNHIII